MSPPWDCRGLLGRDEGALQERLGAPTTRRALGADLWLVFQEPGRVLRARLSNPAGGAAGSPRLASWSATFADGFPTLREIAAATGLWPIVEPDVVASCVRGPLVRRALPDPDRPTTMHSLTATVRNDRFVRIAVFDEPPDWL